MTIYIAITAITIAFLYIGVLYLLSMRISQQLRHLSYRMFTVTDKEDLIIANYEFDRLSKKLTLPAHFDIFDIIREELKKKNRLFKIKQD